MAVAPESLSRASQGGVGLDMTGFRLPVAVVAAVLCAGVTSPSASPPLVMSAPQNDVGNLRTAAAGGDAKAMYNLALKYREGKSVPKDYAQAVQWFRKAAASGSADAMFYLGMLHQNVGSGVPEDPVQAAVWYGKAAKLGHGSAMFYLGVLHWAGRGVLQDLSKRTSGWTSRRSTPNRQRSGREPPTRAIR
jgi:hypothetical protein